MKHLFLNNLWRFFSVMTAVAIFAGCDSAIYDEEGDCDPVHVIRFCYDMNLKFADAFPAEVPSVDLYVFDSEGRLVTTVSRYVSREEARNFSIELRGLAPDHYDLLAWCGVKDSDYFKVNPFESPDMSGYSCRISRTDGDGGVGHVRGDLDHLGIGRLYHGILMNEDMTADEGRHEHTVMLTKNTNTVRVVLQHLSGAPMNKDDYDITITDANGFYDYKNDLLSDVNLVYHPYAVDGGIASFHPSDDPGISLGAQSAVVAELSVGRLMADRREQSLLTVRNSHTGELVFSVPLIDCLLMVSGYHYKEDGKTPMGEQEYLDRQDEYPLTFFLDEKDNWIRSLIYINAWRVVRNDFPVH